MEQNPEENKKKRKKRALGGLDKIVENVKEGPANVEEESIVHLGRIVEHDDSCFKLYKISARSKFNLEGLVQESQEIINNAEAKRKDEEKKRENAKKKAEQKKNKDTVEEIEEVPYMLDELDYIDDMVKLVQLAQDGNEKAKNKVARKHFLLVMKIANKYCVTRYDLDELFSEGNLGLAKAIQSYDAEKAASFMTYASTCINNAIRDYLRNEKKQDEPEADEDDKDNEKFVTNSDGISVITPQYGKFPGDERMGLLLEYMSRLGNDDEIDTGESDNSGQTYNPAIEDLELAFLRKFIPKVINTLDETNQTIIRMKYGLDGNDEHTIVEIAAYVGLSTNAVSARLHNTLDALSRNSILRQYI